MSSINANENKTEVVRVAQPGDAEEAVARFLREMDKAQEIASPIAPKKIRAVPYQQMGATILVAQCPRCGTIAGLTGEGKHLCRSCFTWLQYVREEQ